MNIRRISVVLFVFVAFALITRSIRSASPPASPLIIQNTGQYPDEFRYAILGGSAPVWLAENSLWITLPEEQRYIQLTFPGSNPHPRLVPARPLATNISYYRGSDPAQWHEHVPVFASLRYTDLYPGVDLEISGQNGQITLLVSAPVEMRVEEGENEPRALPLLAGASTPLEQIIPGLDPGTGIPARGTSGGSSLLYSTFLGSNGLDEVHAIATDDLGRIYLAGQMLPVLPPTGPGKFSAPLHAVEAFIARFTPDGSDVEYLLITQSINEEWGKALAVDSSYQAYLAGETDSVDFVTTSGAYDEDFNGSFDGFLMKIDANGTLAYSTLIGTSDLETVNDVAVDTAGNVYITGGTWSPDFPIIGNAYDDSHNDSRDIFVAKFNSAGSELLYSTFIGGDNQEQAESLYLSETNVVYLTGWTKSTNFPTTLNAYDTNHNLDFDTFALKITLGISTLDYSTFLGGNGEDRGFALTLDNMGRAYISGITTSSDFPATDGAYDTTYSLNLCSGLPCPDAFVARLSANGQALDFATYLGDSDDDQVSDVALDSAGKVYVTGTTFSSDFPTSPDAYDNMHTGERDAFLTILNNNLNALVYSTFLGGSESDDGNALWLGKNGGVYLGGDTNSPDFPTTDGAYDITPNGDFDGFAVLFSLPFNPYMTPTPTNTPTQIPTGTLPTPTPSATPNFTPTPTTPPETGWDLFLPLLFRAP